MSTARFKSTTTCLSARVRNKPWVKLGVTDFTTKAVGMGRTFNLLVFMAALGAIKHRYMPDY